LQSLERTLELKDLHLTRHQIERALAEPDGFRVLLARFADATAIEGIRRTMLVGIDQAEEITALTPADAPELDGLLRALLALHTLEPAKPGEPKPLDVRFVLTVRDDSIDATLERLEQVGLPRNRSASGDSTGFRRTGSMTSCGRWRRRRTG